MATATRAKTGFSIPCPHCGQVADEDGVGGLDVRLSDLTVRCPNCDSEISRKALEEMIADAQRLLRWLSMASEA